MRRGVCMVLLQPGYRRAGGGFVRLVSQGSPHLLRRRSETANSRARARSTRRPATCPARRASGGRSLSLDGLEPLQSARSQEDNKPTRVRIERSGDKGGKRVARRQAHRKRSWTSGGAATEQQKSGRPAAAPARDATSRTSSPALTEQASAYLDPHGRAPTPREDHARTWVSARRSRTPRCSKAAHGAARDHRRPGSPARAARRKSVANVQGAAEGMPVGLSPSPSAARAHAGSSSTASDPIADTPHPRLPRPQPAVLRRPRQLLDGRSSEQLIFPEIDYDSIDEVRGLDITITTSAKTDEEAFELLPGSGCPSPRRAVPGVQDVRLRRRRSVQGGGPLASRG